MPVFAFSRVKDLIEVQGIRDNQLVGYGLVVGLNGTGDSLKNAPFTQQSIQTMLERLGVNTRGEIMQTKNVAAVMVTANLPAFSAQGSRIDISVSAMGEAKNLQGGTLLVTPLYGADGQTYAVGQGPVAVGGFSAQGDAATVTRGVPTAGRISNGAIVERETGFQLASLSTQKLSLHNSDLTTATRIAAAVNSFLGGNAAVAADPSNVQLNVPANYPGGVMALLTQIEQVRVDPDQPAKVIIDQTSGVIVMGADVRINTVAIAQGNLTIRVEETPQVSQPEPFSQTGKTVVVPRTSIQVNESMDPTERRETSHSRSICLIGAGKLEEGFAEYEIRNDQRFRAYLHHIVKAPRWQGEPVEGLKILLVGEQGLGDEFMFANIIPDVTRSIGPDGKLQIAVDPRLVPLFQRSFPQAEVGTYDDRTLVDIDGNKALRLIPFASNGNEPDMWAPMGSALGLYRKSLADFPREAFLVPDPARVEKFKADLARLPGKKVGICWRSMMLGAKRAKYYSPIEAWGPIFATPDVSFVNLQYGDCGEEIARIAESFGVTLHTMDGLDLRDDVNGAAALAAALDLVISAPTAAAAMSASVGATVWLLTAGRTWPQLGTEEYPWYASTRVFSPEHFGDWTALMPQVGNALLDFSKK